jgi:hypothetical protein
MLTTGEAITTALRHGTNQGSEAVAYDEQLRLQAHLYLRELRNEVYTLAPFWWKHADGSVTVLANAERGDCPADFAHFGTHGQVWLDGMQRALDWLDPDQLEALRQTSTGQRQDPTYYTLKQQTAAGIRQLDVWPTPGRNVVLLLKNYAKISPELIDVPLAPGAAINVASGGLNGPVTYRVTYVHPDGATEGGFVSASVNPVLQQVDVDPIPISESRRVTGRGVYRTVAGGAQHKLVATIADNVTTSMRDTTLDGSLGVNVPTPSTAVTGLERFPADFHEQIFVGGLIAMLRAATKQVPFSMFSEDWRRNVRRMWADQRSDRHIPRAMPRYGGGQGITRRRWRLLS